jgi:hypothetical protein
MSLRPIACPDGPQLNWPISAASWQVPNACLKLRRTIPSAPSIRLVNGCYSAMPCWHWGCTLTLSEEAASSRGRNGLPMRGQVPQETRLQSGIGQIRRREARRPGPWVGPWPIRRRCRISEKITDKARA